MYINHLNLFFFGTTFISRRESVGLWELEFLLWAIPIIYLCYTMTAVPIWDPVFMVAALWHERWRSTTGGPWQCIIVPGELGKRLGFGEACENHVEGKRTRENYFKSGFFFFLFLYLLFRFFENKLITQNFNQLQGCTSNFKMFGIVYPYSAGSAPFPPLLPHYLQQWKPPVESLLKLDKFWAAAGKAFCWNHPLLFLHEYH